MNDIQKTPSNDSQELLSVPFTFNNKHFEIKVFILNDGGFKSCAYSSGKQVSATYTISYPTALEIKKLTNQTFTHLVEQIRLDITSGLISE